MKLEVPVLSLQNQNNIVRILDMFIELKENLTAELTARQKQYEYYRNKLLSFDELAENLDTLHTHTHTHTHTHGYFYGQKIKWVKLSDITDIYDSLHATPKYVSEGYAMIRVADVKFGTVNISNALKVDEKTYLKFIKKYKPKKDDIIISRVGTFGNICIVGDEPICLGQNTSIIHPKINCKYLYYYLLSNTVQQWINSNVNGAGYKSLSLANIKDIPVAVPSLEIQEKIVNILDKFDKLTNDISEGLPAEIEARQKQYEYYRNKLLSFKELKTA